MDFGGLSAGSRAMAPGLNLTEGEERTGGGKTDAQIQEGRVSFRRILQEVERDGVCAFSVKGLIQEEFPGLEGEEEKLVQNILAWAEAHRVELIIQGEEGVGFKKVEDK